MKFNSSRLHCSKCGVEKDYYKMAQCSIPNCMEMRCKRCSFGYGYNQTKDSYDHYFQVCRTHSSSKCSYDEHYCPTHYEYNKNNKVVCCLCK